MGGAVGEAERLRDEKPERSSGDPSSRGRGKNKRRPRELLRGERPLPEREGKSTYGNPTQQSKKKKTQKEKTKKQRKNPTKNKPKPFLGGEPRALEKEGFRRGRLCQGVAKRV